MSGIENMIANAIFHKYVLRRRKKNEAKERAVHQILVERVRI